jgi:hypothetical protein
VIAERFAKRVDVLGEVALFDERVVPEPFEQFPLGHHPVGVLREQHQEVECLGRERNGGAGALQTVERDVEAERPEFIEGLVRQ